MALTTTTYHSRPAKESHLDTIYYEMRMVRFCAESYFDDDCLPCNELRRQSSSREVSTGWRWGSVNPHPMNERNAFSLRPFFFTTGIRPFYASVPSARACHADSAGIRRRS
jgi:hypothetical protein